MKKRTKIRIARFIALCFELLMLIISISIIVSSFKNCVSNNFSFSILLRGIFIAHLISAATLLIIMLFDSWPQMFVNLKFFDKLGLVLGGIVSLSIGVLVHARVVLFGDGSYDDNDYSNDKSTSNKERSKQNSEKKLKDDGVVARTFLKMGDSFSTNNSDINGYYKNVKTKISQDAMSPYTIRMTVTADFQSNYSEDFAVFEREKCNRKDIEADLDQIINENIAFYRSLYDGPKIVVYRRVNRIILE